MATDDVARIIGLGRRVLSAHPTIALDAAGLLHALDELTDEERLDARRYLLHVYGLTVGITNPNAHTLAPWQPPPNVITRRTDDADLDLDAATIQEGEPLGF